MDCIFVSFGWVDGWEGGAKGRDEIEGVARAGATKEGGSPSRHWAGNEEVLIATSVSEGEGHGDGRGSNFVTCTEGWGRERGGGKVRSRLKDVVASRLISIILVPLFQTLDQRCTVVILGG